MEPAEKRVCGPCLLGDGSGVRPELVERNVTATAPDQLRDVDIACCRTFAWWVYAAFVIDAFPRRVVGWQLSKSLSTDRVLAALEMGNWCREHAGQDVPGLTHHSDKGVQYVSARCAQRLTEAGAVDSASSASRRTDAYVSVS